MDGRFHDPKLIACLEASLVNSEATLHAAVAIGRAVARAGDRVEALAAAAAAATAAVAPGGDVATAPDGRGLMDTPPSTSSATATADAAAAAVAAAAAAATAAAAVAESAEERLRELLELAPGKTDPTDTLAQVAEVRADVAATATMLATALAAAPRGGEAVIVSTGGRPILSGTGSSGGGSGHAPIGGRDSDGSAFGGSSDDSHTNRPMLPPIGASAKHSAVLPGWRGDADARGGPNHSGDGSGGSWSRNHKGNNSRDGGGGGDVSGGGGSGSGGSSGSSGDRGFGDEVFPGQHRPWGRSLFWHRGTPAGFPDGGGFRGLSAPFVRQVIQSVFLASFITWMLSLLGVIGGLIGVSWAYAESQRNPVLVRDVVTYSTLPLPVITLCTSILGVPHFSNFPTKKYPGQPLFTTRSFGDASGTMAVYPESLDKVEQLAIGPDDANCSDVNSLRYMDAAVLNRLTGVPSMKDGRNGPLQPPPAGGLGTPVNISAGEPYPGLGLGSADRTTAEMAGLCGACFRIGATPQILLNGTAAEAGKDVVVQAEVVTANVLESCIIKPMNTPVERVLTLVHQIFEHSARLQEEGVLDFDGANVAGGWLDDGASWDIFKWLRPPAFETEVELQVLGAKSAYLDFLCNVYLFSGFFYPAPPDTNIRFRLDHRGPSYPKWRKAGSGPYFQTESLLRTAVTQARSTRVDSWLIDLYSSFGPPPKGLAPPPYIDEDSYPVWRHSKLGPVFTNFVSVYVQEPRGGRELAPVAQNGNGREGDGGGSLRQLVPQPTPNLNDLVQRVRSGSNIVRLRLKRRAGYGVESQRYTAARVERLLLSESNAFASPFNSSYSSWLLEFGLDSFVVERFTPRPSFGMSLFIADVFNVVGVFTGLSLYTLLVLPGTLLLARSVRARQRQLEVA
ncbi:hypothetical protein MMPV_007637 [Pyropia vietnamensis]